MTPQPGNEERKKSPRDFYFHQIIGEGSFSTVYLASEVESGRECAIKVLNKRHIIREKKMEYVNREKKALLRLSSNDTSKDLASRFFVHLWATFQDSERLYFVLSYAKNGELLQHILRHKSFKLEWTQYYTAELLMAIEYLKAQHVVHRDLKPENILLDKNLHILVTDFGSSKINGDDEVNKKTDDLTRRRRNSFVGTAQYVSPEVLHGEETSYSSDLWSFGCVIYQMITGLTPFRAPSEYLIFQKITNLDYEFPENIDEDIKDLIEKLLVILPDDRLGASDSIPYTSIRAHNFFKNINWNDLGPPPNIYDPRKEPTVTRKNSKPGFNDEIATHLQLATISSPSMMDLVDYEENEEIIKSATPNRKKSEAKLKLTEFTDEVIAERLLEQQNDEYHCFVDGQVIIKKGFLEKKKGLFGFARKRMFLLTLGPRLFYVDPATMTLKGEVPLGESTKTEAKNFKVFYIHTPNRIYYLEDTSGYALEWCRAIDDVIKHYFSPEAL